MKIDSEQLAYWYLRLNGFLTIRNFILHPDRRGPQRTEADILGVRFPYRKELMTSTTGPLIDDKRFTRYEEKTHILLAEVTEQQFCKLNGPWTEPEKENLQRLLFSIGAFRENEINSVAEAIYTSQEFTNDKYRFSLACIGPKINTDITRDFPAVDQILYDEILDWIYGRFHKHYTLKTDHPQWDNCGNVLWKIFNQNWCNSENFKSEVKQLVGLSH
jgi:hypothetical protein